MIDSTDAIRYAAEMACLLEASAEKPGNVTPTHRFADMVYEDFLRSAIAIGPEMALAGQRGVGETILAAIQATKRVVQSNTNLGIVLLLAPLARAAAMTDAASGLRQRLGEVLHTLTIDDARAAYEAIRLAGPGGMDEAVDAQDVRSEVPTITLREAMAMAAERDSIASEYLSDCAIVFERCLPAYEAATAAGLAERDAVVQMYLAVLAEVPDTLIARKAGWLTAQRVSQQAAAVIACGGMATAAGRNAVAAFDDDLRAESNRLNPGTTADLVAAALFVNQMMYLTPVS